MRYRKFFMRKKVQGNGKIVLGFEKNVELFEVDSPSNTESALWGLPSAEKATSILVVLRLARIALALFRDHLQGQGLVQSVGKAVLESFEDGGSPELFHIR